jgi:hypothetical protein
VADLAHLCDTATEYAMHDSITAGSVRMIEQQDFDRALRYDNLAACLKKRRMP